MQFDTFPPLTEHDGRILSAALLSFHQGRAESTGEVSLLPADFLPADEDEIPEETGTLEVIPLGDLQRPEHDDHQELLRYRYLCRGGGMLLLGPTGIGKSSFAMQAAILWAIGREAFAIQPRGSLRSLLIQAENDTGDLAEMRDGVLEGMGLGEDDQRQACEQIFTLTCDSLTGQAFLDNVARPAIARVRPDLVWLDPLNGYLGEDCGNQKAVSAFLRQGWNQLIHKFGCGLIIAHHVNKPPSSAQKPNWSTSEMAYLGSGSSDLANWARAILALRGTESSEIYELVAAKRGRRLGWRRPDGATKSTSKLIKHSDAGICWIEAHPNELEDAKEEKSMVKISPNLDALWALLPPGGLPSGEWRTLADERLGFCKSKFHNLRKILIKQDRILEAADGTYKPCTKALK